MSQKLKTNLLKYGITGGVCLVFVVSYLISQDVLNLPLLDQLRVACDAFTVPGMLCVFAGVMLWAANEGAFTAIGFIMSYVFRSLIPGPGKRENYGEYRERMMEKKAVGYGFLFVVGLVCLAFSAVFLILFHMQRS